jgi:flagellum-specific ATP synthase
MANRVTQLMAAYADLEDLVNIGAYTQGTNPTNDLAVRMHLKILDFLKQGKGDPVSLEQAKTQLVELTAAIDKEARLIEQQQRQSSAAVAGPKRK